MSQSDVPACVATRCCLVFVRTHEPQTRLQFKGETLAISSSCHLQYTAFIGLKLFDEPWWYAPSFWNLASAL